MSLWDRTKHGPAAGPTETAKPANRRAANRKRQRLIDGFVSSGRMPPQPCTVCDMSATGSKVELWGDNAKRLLTGDRVTLYIPGDRTEVDGEVMWRKSNVMGLRFTSAFRAPTQRYG